MTAPQDTREIVERKASILGTMALYNFGKGSAGRDILNDTAATLRRLWERVEAAEHAALTAQRSADDWMAAEQAAQDAADSARTAALRVAVAKMQEIPLSVEGSEHHPDMRIARIAMQLAEMMRELCMSSALALIEKEPPHDR